MNILIFGPNGSGKGTLGAKIKEKYPVAHIESGAIFRENIKGGTELGKAAKAYIDRGDLVPDDITIPMILDRLQRDDCKGGWLLDGFPRNKVQAEKLDRDRPGALPHEGDVVRVSTKGTNIIMNPFQGTYLQNNLNF